MATLEQIYSGDFSRLGLSSGDILAVHVDEVVSRKLDIDVFRTEIAEKAGVAIDQVIVTVGFGFNVIRARKSNLETLREIDQKNRQLQILRG